MDANFIITGDDDVIGIDKQEEASGCWRMQEDRIISIISRVMPYSMEATSTIRSSRLVSYLALIPCNFCQFCVLKITKHVFNMVLQ